MSDAPKASRATFPADYGQRGGAGDKPLDWVDVDKRIGEAPNYWMVTIAVSGRPHARPIDGVWVLGSLCFGGSPEARWIKNLQRNPAASVHLPSGDEVVILEGEVEYVTDPDDPRASASTEASRVKYPQYFSGDTPVLGEPRPFWALRPAVVYAWALESFPKRATRWTFDR